MHRWHGWRRNRICEGEMPSKKDYISHNSLGLPWDIEKVIIETGASGELWHCGFFPFRKSLRSLKSKWKICWTFVDVSAAVLHAVDTAGKREEKALSPSHRYNRKKVVKGSSSSTCSPITNKKWFICKICKKKKNYLECKIFHRQVIRGPGNMRKYYDNMTTEMMTDVLVKPGPWVNYFFSITVMYLNSRFQLCKVTWLPRCLIYSAVGWNSWPTMTHTLPNKRRQSAVAVGTPRQQPALYMKGICSLLFHSYHFSSKAIKSSEESIASNMCKNQKLATKQLTNSGEPKLLFPTLDR